MADGGSIGARGGGKPLRFSKNDSSIAIALPRCASWVVLEPDPWKIGRRVWEMGWGRSVPSGKYGICND